MLNSCMSQTSLPIQNFSYRFLNKKSKVYFITKKNAPDVITTRQLYTVPFKNKETDEVRNVVLGYINKSYGVGLYEELCKTHDDIMLNSMDLDEFQYRSQLMKLPLVVMMNSYCDVRDHEVYFELYYNKNEIDA